MKKREELKQKQNEKKKAKIERERIVKKYLEEIDKELNNKYIEMLLGLEELNKDLEKASVEYFNIINKLNIFLNESLIEMENHNNSSEISDELIEMANDVYEDIQRIEEKNKIFYNTISVKDRNAYKIINCLPEMADQVSNIINQLAEELKDDKNQAYIISMLKNRSLDLFTKHNKHVIEMTKESKVYVDVYMDAREQYIDFVNQSKEIIYKKEDELLIALNKITSDIDNNNNKQNKHKERLRIEYSQLESFLKYKGFEPVRQNSTTHAIWRCKKTGISTPIPNKSGTIPQGTTSKILKQIGSNRNELAEFLYA